MIKNFSAADAGPPADSGSVSPWTRKFLIRTAALRLIQLDAARSLSDLRMPDAGRLEMLEGTAGQFRVAVNRSWHIVFRFENGHAYDVGILGQKGEIRFAVRQDELPAVHPGSFLSEILHSSGLSQSELARRLGIARMSISHVVNRKRKITTEMACLLGRFFHQSPHYWMNLQHLYDLKMMGPVLKDRLSAVFPLKSRPAIHADFLQETPR